MLFKRRHDLRHLGEDVRRARSKPVEANAAAISWMIHQSWRGSPGGRMTGRAHLHRGPCW
jgi:hypothetical protein